MRRLEMSNRILDPGSWILDAGCWMLDAGYQDLVSRITCHSIASGDSGRRREQMSATHKFKPKILGFVCHW